MILALIFDLDSCLSAANEVGDHLFQPAFEAISRANEGTVSPEALRQACSDCWRFPFDSVARKYGFTEAMIAAGWSVFTRTTVSETMHGYGDLAVLAELPARRFLVTSGFCRLQESKVEALGIAHLFEAIHIDAIDEPGSQGKENIFRALLENHGFKPEQVMVVGDNPDSEIAAGNRLRLVTVQILRPGVSRGDNAGHYISTLAELKALLAHG
jgi:phosphoglycolate phosphatase-like HAD superfamily hydrolase